MLRDSVVKIMNCKKLSGRKRIGGKDAMVKKLLAERELWSENG